MHTYCRCPNDVPTNLDDHGEILTTHVVVGLDENLPQTTLPDRIILGVELVESMERVAILCELSK